MSQFSRDEVESQFRRWRIAVDARDLGAMESMLAPDVRGGNAPSLHGGVID